MLIGTAGHIDHGKTTLIRALTGVDTDRLPEEKRRGISIQLGYAYLPDGAAGEGAGTGSAADFGFIDVPGHEKFIPTMLAGAAGIDLALLVVAADDGVMPQTREHLAILTLLGIAQGGVAITKCDRADAARIAQVEREVAALLAGTPLAGSPCFPVAAANGPADPGVATLKTWLLAQGGDTGAARDKVDGRGFRLAIDRSFALAGAGTVVTGTAFAGRVQVGDKLTVFAPERGVAATVRVRSLHANNRPADAGHAGQRLALALVGIDHGAVERGDWLVADFLARPAERTRVDVRLSLLADAPRPLTHWSAVHLHHGAAQVTARVALLNETGTLAPGDSGYAQLVLDRPLAVCHGDRLVLRDGAAQATLAGAVALDPFGPARRRKSPERLALLATLEVADPQRRLHALIDAAPWGVDLAELACAHNLAAAAHVPSDLALPPGAVLAPRAGRVFSATRWQALQDVVAARLAAHHEAFADEVGVERERLRRMALPQLASTAFFDLLEALRDAGRIVLSGAAWHLPEHTVELDARERLRAEKLLPWLRDEPFDPPWVRDIAQRLGEPESETRRLLKKLAARGEAYQVVKDLFYAPEALSRLVAIVASLAGAGEEGSEPGRLGLVKAADFRDATGLGRKRAIQILEYFDRVGYTRRIGSGAAQAHGLRGEPPVR
ncbi:selenocysteine-specific elongation factor [Oryzomicrobium terrae]|uniref:Selenocysteine-specific elongation factor n=1 Tax=Oryzomicrobium terrae TaxID=1735038 RepID=A0A5C1E785_9RHOO|nr:selenocysteine-specific translation elongation factor [Oryzomicrobium terrae]QEL64484.1 selenocysteine-specific elongation factor [Oryzomicrobium terrae]